MAHEDYPFIAGEHFINPAVVVFYHLGHCPGHHTVVCYLPPCEVRPECVVQRGEDIPDLQEAGLAGLLGISVESYLPEIADSLFLSLTQVVIISRDALQVPYV